MVVGVGEKREVGGWGGGCYVKSIRTREGGKLEESSDRRSSKKESKRRERKGGKERGERERERAESARKQRA